MNNEDEVSRRGVLSMGLDPSFISVMVSACLSLVYSSAWYPMSIAPCFRPEGTVRLEVIAERPETAASYVGGAAYSSVSDI